MKKETIQASDQDTGRTRWTRTTVFFITPILLMLLGGILVAYLAYVFLPLPALSYTFLSLPALSLVGAVVGATAGFVAFLSMKHLFIVKNNTTGMLVTLNQLMSLVGKEPHVVYGPGTHFSFPWEARFAQNNIPVVEVAEDFQCTALCSDGTINGKGSFRLRPDVKNPINYLSGVAAAGKDLRDLIVSFVNDWCAKKTVEEAIRDKHKLNSALYRKFAQKHTEFEDRFGVGVGDVTMSEILMSDEVQRTRGAINESRFIKEGTAILLGFETAEEMQIALKDGKNLKQEDVDRARREFRIISGNMDGATVSRFEVDIRGLSPEAAAAVSALVAANPNAAAAAIKKAASGGKASPNKKKGP